MSLCVLKGPLLLLRRYAFGTPTFYHTFDGFKKTKVLWMTVIYVINFICESQINKTRRNIYFNPNVTLLWREVQCRHLVDVIINNSSNSCHRIPTIWDIVKCCTKPVSKTIHVNIIKELYVWLTGEPACYTPLCLDCSASCCTFSFPQVKLHVFIQDI